MKITFAGLKTSGKVEMVWCMLDLMKYNPEATDTTITPRTTDYVIIWGRRGGKLQYVRKNNEYYMYLHERVYTNEFLNGDWVNKYNLTRFGFIDMAATCIYEKIKHGYIPVEAENINDIYPTFSQDLDKINFWEQFR